MNIKKKAALIGFIVLLNVIVCAYFQSSSNAASTVDAAGTFSYHVGIGNGIAWGTATLVASTTERINTGLNVVHSCSATIGTVSSSTPTANVLLCIPADQSKIATRGRIDVRAGMIGISATGGIRFTNKGNTDANWQAFSYQAR